MGLLTDLGNIAKQFESGQADAAQVHSAYDEVSRSVPAGTLADGLTHAFNSDQTPPFGQMVSQLFQNSNPDQKAGILNRISSSLGPSGLSGLSGVLAGTGGLGGLAAALSKGGQVTPSQAQQVSPDQVQVLARHAEKNNPSVVNAAAGFYAQHPTLVKAIGASALALLVSKVSQSRR